MEGNYKGFLHDLHGALANNPTHTVVYRNKQVPVLAQQRGPYLVPARWILVNLVGTDGDKTTIAVRDDNIYIVGFTNSRGSWFVFKNRAHLIPGSTLLPFGDCYKDLLGGGYKELEGITLGKENMLKAVQMLARYHPNPHNSYKSLKVALATLCVMVAEAERFVPINETVADRWEDTPRITAMQAKYVVLWSDMSCALLNWRTTGVWRDKGNKLQKANINSPGDALGILGLVLWPNSCSFDATTHQFRCDCGKRRLADDSSTICQGTF